MALEPRSGKAEGKAGGEVKAERRHGRGFHSPSVTARKRLGEVAAGHGFAEPQVLLRWPEVVGLFRDLPRKIQAAIVHG